MVLDCGMGNPWLTPSEYVQGTVYVFAMVTIVYCGGAVAAAPPPPPLPPLHLPHVVRVATCVIVIVEILEVEITVGTPLSVTVWPGVHVETVWVTTSVV
jgi:hypothetical protein